MVYLVDTFMIATNIPSSPKFHLAGGGPSRHVTICTTKPGVSRLSRHAQHSMSRLFPTPKCMGQIS